MSKPGRKPAPTALKLAKGTRKARINKNEPIAASGVPECPADLNDFGHRAWEWICSNAQAMGTLTLADAQAMYIFAEAYAHYRDAKDALKTHGVMVESGGSTRSDGRGGDVFIEESATLKKNPAWDIAKDAMNIMLRVLTEFGLTPSSRSRIDLGSNGDGDDLDAFLSGKKAK